MDLHERLVAARKHANFDSAAEAAHALGVPYPTYAGHENGSSGFRSERGELYARRFKVRFEWLMRGRGPMVGDEPAESIVAVMGLIGAGAEILPEYDQVPPEGLEEVTLPFPLPAEMIAFRVEGESMLPLIKPDTVIVVYREQKRPIEDFYGDEAAVRTEDGRRFIKTIERGSKPGYVDLMSPNARTMRDVRLEWIGEIFATLPRRQIARIVKMGGIQGRLQLKAG